ncbi:hypothetical protein BH23PLA1_BH23PLA1_28220 [soil metagenome]
MGFLSGVVSHHQDARRPFHAQEAISCLAVRSWHYLRGIRQYDRFAGLAAKNGALAAYLSENGAKSFGDRYARNLAVTPELIPKAPADAPEKLLDAAWSAVGFVFDNEADTVTVSLDGQATERWFEDPAWHPFFQWPARGWLQAELLQRPGSQEGQDSDFPKDQLYAPPEEEPIGQEIVSETADQRVEVLQFSFTRVKVTSSLDNQENAQIQRRELVALRVNPFWFGHDLYSPATPEAGGPFTIGRVIPTSRSMGNGGWIGGVAVFNRPLNDAQMEVLTRIGRDRARVGQPIQLLESRDVTAQE